MPWVNLEIDGFVPARKHMSNYAAHLQKHTRCITNQWQLIESCLESIYRDQKPTPNSWHLNWMNCHLSTPQLISSNTASHTQYHTLAHTQLICTEHRHFEQLIQINEMFSIWIARIPFNWFYTNLHPHSHALFRFRTLHLYQPLFVWLRFYFRWSCLLACLVSCEFEWVCVYVYLFEWLNQSFRWFCLMFIRDNVRRKTIYTIEFE